MQSGAAAGQAQIAGAVAWSRGRRPIEGDRRAQQADDLFGHRHVSGPCFGAVLVGPTQEHWSNGAVCRACTNPPPSIEAWILSRGVRCTTNLLAGVRRGVAGRHSLGEERIRQVVLQGRVRATGSPAATSGRRCSRSPPAARGARPPREICPPGRWCRRGSRSGPRQFRGGTGEIRTTSSFSVSATTFTQGGYSLIQYSGMTVPFGSSTRSTRTVYQGFSTGTRG